MTTDDAVVQPTAIRCLPREEVTRWFCERASTTFVSINCVFFFFSSRRRHTRFDCDWSSDVCSSDLRGTVHRLVECAARVGVQAGRIHEGDLRLGQSEHAQDAVARGLRTRCHDAELVPDEHVEKRRLADVRPSHQRSVSTAELRCWGGGAQAYPSGVGEVSIWVSMHSAAFCSARRRLEPRPCTRRPSSGTSQLTSKVCAWSSPSMLRTA